MAEGQDEKEIDQTEARGQDGHEYKARDGWCLAKVLFHTILSLKITHGLIAAGSQEQCTDPSQKVS